MGTRLTLVWVKPDVSFSHPISIEVDLFFCDCTETRNLPVSFSDFPEEIARRKVLRVSTMSTQTNGEEKYG
jgi:hypothetical protein